MNEEGEGEGDVNEMRESFESTASSSSSSSHLLPILTLCSINERLQRERETIMSMVMRGEWDEWVRREVSVESQQFHPPSSPCPFSASLIFAPTNPSDLLDSTQRQHTPQRVEESGRRACCEGGEHEMDPRLAYNPLSSLYSLWFPCCCVLFLVPPPPPPPLLFSLQNLDRLRKLAVQIGWALGRRARQSLPSPTSLLPLLQEVGRRVPELPNPQMVVGGGGGGGGGGDDIRRGVEEIVREMGGRIC